MLARFEGRHRTIDGNALRAVGYRLSEGNRAVAYLPDHEPALGARRFPEPSE
jgi:ribonuclease BN (tRNA processing enzyme)